LDGVKSKSENMLDLIMLNATTRVMSDSEIIQQYEMLEKTFKELEAEGKKFKGRLRERIADALNISPSQVGKIENINRHAIDEIKDAVIKGDMSISTANEVSNLDIKEQKELIEHKPVSEIKHKEVKSKKEKVQVEEPEIIPDFELEPEESEDEESEENEQEKIAPGTNNEPVVLSEKEITALNHFLPDLIEQCKSTDPYYYLTLKELLEKII